MGLVLEFIMEELKSKLILLLCGGDKKSQDKDIEKAKEYLRDYQSRN